MRIHRPSQADLACRNQKIATLARQGIDYEMIGLRYGLSATTVSRILGKLGEKQNYIEGFGSASDVRYLGGVD